MQYFDVTDHSPELIIYLFLKINLNKLENNLTFRLNIYKIVKVFSYY